MADPAPELTISLEPSEEQYVATKAYDAHSDCPALTQMPRIVTRILRIDSTMPEAAADLSKIICSEPALLERLLRLANTDFWGGGRIVRSAAHAIEIAGVPAVRTLAAGLAIAAHLARHRPTGIDSETFWKRALFACSAARAIAFVARVESAEEAFVAALLMDTGMLALDVSVGDAYGDLNRAVPTHADLEAAERSNIGLSHAAAGCALACAWCMDSRIADAIDFHHDPDAPVDAATQALARCICLAGRCADVFMNPEPQWALADFRRAAADLFQLDDAACDVILDVVSSRAQLKAPVLGIAPESVKEAAVGAPRIARDSLSRWIKDRHQAGTGAERRTAPRFERDGFITILRQIDGRPAWPMLARFRDASAGGIGITLDNPLSVGEEFVVRVPHVRGQKLPVVYRVMRCFRRDDPTSPKAAPKYHIGAKILRVVRETEA